jgi:hypothetical protein
MIYFSISYVCTLITSVYRSIDVAVFFTIQHLLYLTFLPRGLFDPLLKVIIHDTMPIFSQDLFASLYAWEYGLVSAHFYYRFRV